MSLNLKIFGVLKHIFYSGRPVRVSLCLDEAYGNERLSSPCGSMCLGKRFYLF